MARNYVQIYHDFMETAETMKDADLANLIRAMLKYGRGEDPAPYLQSELVRVLFTGSFKGQIDRNNAFDMRKSERIKEANRRKAAQNNGANNSNNLQPINL